MMPPDNPAETTSAWLRTEEHGDLKIPLERLVKAGRLDVYPEVLKSGLFKVYFKGDELIFQAGGWIGMLHINPDLVIEVTPRVPIANLERIIAQSRFDRFIFLDAFSKTFAPSTQMIPSIIDVLANRLIQSVSVLQGDGLHYEYQVRQYTGSFPRGRINPSKTALHRLRLGRSPQSVYEAWERTYDVAANRYIRSAIRRILLAFEGAPNKSGRRKHILALRQADEVFEIAKYFGNESRADVQALMSSVPPSKPNYRGAIAIAQLILEDSGIELRSSIGNINLSPILVLMEDVFERYVRNVLTVFLPPNLVRDGNKLPPDGAKTFLINENLDEGTGFKIPPVTPDFVIYDADDANPVLVADVKYKIVREFPSRDDVNQVLTYALTYRCKIACLFYPRRSRHSITGLVRLGQVGDVLLLGYFLDLGAEDLEAEEALMATTICNLCQTAPL